MTNTGDIVVDIIATMPLHDNKKISNIKWNKHFQLPQST